MLFGGAKKTPLVPVTMTVPDYYYAMTGLGPDIKTSPPVFTGPLNNMYPVVGHGPGSDTVVLNQPPSGSIATPNWYNLPWADWCPRSLYVENDNDFDQVINLTVSAFMGACVYGVYVYLYRVPTVSLGAGHMGTPPDYSITNHSFNFTDTIPKRSASTYQAYFSVTANHDVDRDYYGAGLRSISASHNSWA